MATTQTTLCFNRVVAPTGVKAQSRSVASVSRPAPTKALGSSFLCGGSNKFQGAALKMSTPRRTGQAPIREVATCAAKVSGIIKLALEAGKASPAPPVGPALGAQGVNIMAFCKEYNAKTQDKMGSVIPVEITVYEDKSFKFIMKTPPASKLLLKYSGAAKGAPAGCQDIVGSITEAQLKEIAEIKLPDLNANDVEAAMKIVGGTAKNMGIAIEG